MECSSKAFLAAVFFHAFFTHPVYSKLRFCHHMSHGGGGIAHRPCLSQAQKYLLSIPETVPGLKRLTVIYAATSGLSPVGWLVTSHAPCRFPGTTSTLNLQRRGKSSRALDVVRRAPIPMETESGPAAGSLWVGVSPFRGTSVYL